MNNVFTGSISSVWARALSSLTERGVKELVPLVVTIDEFDEVGRPVEDDVVRQTLGRFLSQQGLQSVDTVANTIFPISLWNETKPAIDLYDRYKQILPRLRKASPKNRKGLYFERMITGGPPNAENQLEFALSNYSARVGARRSMLQLGIFQPRIDHSNAAYLGFPCLQQISFAPTASGINVCAFYAVQYMVERAYGNYLGLCRLGKFVASRLGMPLATVTCMAGIAELDVNKGQAHSLLEQMELETEI
jgi:hypothetical protein